MPNERTTDDKEKGGRTSSATMSPSLFLLLCFSGCGWCGEGAVAGSETMDTSPLVSGGAAEAVLLRGMSGE